MKRIAYKIINDDTAIAYYVGKKRSKNLSGFNEMLKSEITKLIIDKSFNSYICDCCPGGWNRYQLLNNDRKVKCFDFGLNNASDEYDDGNVHHVYTARHYRNTNGYYFKNKYKSNKLKIDNKIDEPFEFYDSTVCQFKACKMPKRRPNYVSYDRNGEVSSMYWYGTDSKGSYVIRYSNHWSKISKNIKSGDKELFQCQTVSSCWWTLVGNTATKCGKAYTSDFKKRML